MALQNLRAEIMVAAAAIIVGVKSPAIRIRVPKKAPHNSKIYSRQIFHLPGVFYLVLYF